MKRFAILSAVAVVLAGAACDEKQSGQPSPVASATPSASAAAAPAASDGEAPLPQGVVRFTHFMGKSSFLIDAPLEKIKGASDELRGHLDVDPKDLSKSRGAIMVRLATVKTNTFGNMDKDSAQTEHARNWMEVGAESPPDARMKYEWATFTVTSVQATPNALTEAQDEGGARKLSAKVTGDLNVHGVVSQKTVPVSVTFNGPPGAPTDFAIRTEDAFSVSMKEHDVKPRDKIGSFLNGALDRIGKKIDDRVQVSVDFIAKAAMPEHP